MFLRLGELIFSWKIGSSLKRRGPPRRGSVHLGEPKDRKWDFLVRLGEAIAHLGEPLHLGEGRIRLGEPMTA